MKKSSPKIIIAGTGRAGTTFLIILLTRLGFDTGYKPYIEDFGERIRAGCEYDLFVSNLKKQKQLLAKAPQILKHPKYSQHLKKLIEKKIISVSHLIIPVRDIKQVAKSRISVGLSWKIRGVSGPKETLSSQEKTLTWVLGKIVEASVVCDIPTTYIKYPDLVINEDYCFDKLAQVFNINRQQFSKVFQELSDPKLVSLRINKQKQILYKKPKVSLIRKIICRFL